MMASRSAVIPTPGNAAAKEGAMLTYTGEVISNTRTFSTSQEICLAFCGQMAKHWPHKTHSSPTT